MHDFDRTLLESGSDEIDQENDGEDYEYVEEDGF